MKFIIQLTDAQREKLQKNVDRVNSVRTSTKKRRSNHFFKPITTGRYIKNRILFEFTNLGEDEDHEGAPRDEYVMLRFSSMEKEGLMERRIDPYNAARAEDGKPPLALHEVMQEIIYGWMLSDDPVSEYEIRDEQRKEQETWDRIREEIGDLKQENIDLKSQLKTERMKLEREMAEIVAKWEEEVNATRQNVAQVTRVFEKNLVLQLQLHRLGHREMTPVAIKEAEVLEKRFEKENEPS